MTYSKQTWADSPSTSSPLSAARLNHMEDGLVEAETQNSARTFTLPHSNGGLGGSVATSITAATAGSVRFVVKLPETVTQWRIKIRNWEYAQTSKTAGTLKKLVVGTHARATTGTAGETGSFTGSTATTIVSTDQTIPGTSGSWYTSPWVSVANGFSTGDLFTANTEYLVAFGYTFGSSTAVQTGAGRGWHWTNSTSATDPTIAGSGATQQYVPFDYVIEYQVTNCRRKVCLVIGDSISEGITGSNSALASTPLWRNPFNLWAARANRMVVNLSLAGIALTHYATTPASNYLWTRQDLAAYTIDEIIISAGSNDFSSSRTLAQMQADVLTIVSYLQTTLGLTAPIYMATLLARGSTGDAVRLTYHEWISGRPTFCTDVIDFDGATRGTTAQAIVDQYTPDTIHPSWLGAHVMATELGNVMP